jgi:diguanylate cyclase (GGDEF)-like protein
MQVRQRFRFVSIAITTAIIGATMALILMQRSSAILAFETATTNLGNGMSQQTSSMINMVDQALKDAKRELPSGANAEIGQVQTAMRSKKSRDLLVDLGKRLRFVNAVAFIGADGVVENSSGILSLPGNGFTDQDIFVQLRTIDDDAAFIGMPIKSALNGKWVAYFARRVNDAHGTFSGIVAAEISLDSIEKFYEVAMPARRSVSLLRKDDVVMVRYPARIDEIGKKIPDRQAWHAAVAQGGGTYQASDFFTGTQIVAFVRPLKNLPLIVQASVNEADVLADWPQQIMWLVLGGLSTIAGSLLLLRYLARQVVRLERSQASVVTKNCELETVHIQLDAALSNISLGVCLFNGDKKLIVCNRSYREIYHLSPEMTKPGTSFAEIVGYRFAAGSLPPCTPEEYLLSRDAVAKTGVRVETVVELVNDRAILIAHQPMPNGGWVATHEDITDRRETDRHIRFLAQHDPLTGMANRAYFTEKLEEAVSRLNMDGEPFTILYLDLDRFKIINDTLGHPAGDQLIREAAQRLKSSLRETDVLARLGGDEFAILQQGKESSREDAAGLANRILEIMAQPYDLDGQRLYVTASVGIALAPENASTGTDILKMADIALYGAKAAGRNEFLFFHPSMLSDMDSRRQLEVDLRLAISRNEFELHYQALIDAKTRRQAGFEALVRWRSPTRGLVMPDQFIPLAEETGMILSLGAWVLKKACADATKWPTHLTVSVNVSPLQLAQPNLLQVVQGALTESTLLANRLELEITETALFKNDVDCLNLIHHLKKLGVSISLDDFGTGFSSLSYLTMIPFDKIKIDRSFIVNITTRSDSAAIVAAVLALGHNLKTKTVAEGVETEKQFRKLRDAGVDLVQGYLFGKPCPVSELILDDGAVTNSTASAA